MMLAFSPTYYSAWSAATQVASASCSTVKSLPRYHQQHTSDFHSTSTCSWDHCMQWVTTLAKAESEHRCSEVYKAALVATHKIRNFFCADVPSVRVHVHEGTTWQPNCMLHEEGLTVQWPAGAAHRQAAQRQLYRRLPEHLRERFRSTHIYWGKRGRRGGGWECGQSKGVWIPCRVWVWSTTVCCTCSQHVLSIRVLLAGIDPTLCNLKIEFCLQNITTTFQHHQGVAVLRLLPSRELTGFSPRVDCNFTTATLTPYYQG